MVKFILEVSIGGEGGGVIGDINSYYTSVNTKTREHGSQSSRKLKMAPVR